MLELKGQTIKKHYVDFCVIGGGLAGTIAAVSACRRGLKVVLMQDRAMLGGNCSSEVRLYIRGAVNEFDRETGLLAEFEEENIYRNAELSNSVWDSVLLGKAFQEKNLTLLTNCSCLDAETDGDTIISATGWQLNTYTVHIVYAKYFADCSGDSVLAPLVGAKYTFGKESKYEYGESLAPEKADKSTMGMSCLLQAREVDRKVEYIPPEWAFVYETDDDIGEVLPGTHIRAARNDAIGTNGNNLWWMEISSKTDGITDTEENREKLMKIAYGVWDHIKNRQDHGADNWELEWVGVLPGKRESRRYIGEYVLKQDDLFGGNKFDDTVAYGGWPLDDHDSRGMDTQKTVSVCLKIDEIYGIPYRSLFSVNVKNLFFAGRNISATHLAMSSTRVLGTCALLGQAVGTAAAVCSKYGVSPKNGAEYIREIQSDLMEDGVYLPGIKREISALTFSAKTNLTDDERAVLFNGVERPRGDGKINYIEKEIGESIVYEFDKPRHIGTLRLQFDLDYSRESVTPNYKMRIFAMRMFKGKDFVPVKVANTIVKSFTVYADGVPVFTETNNYHSLVKVPLYLSARKIEIKFNETRGYEKVRLFACDFIR